MKVSLSLNSTQLNATGIRELIAEYRFPLGIFVLVRFWTWLWGYVAATYISPPWYVKNQLYGLSPVTGGIGEILWGPWLRWDTIWYVKIAQEGYSAANLSSAYFFLYPLLMKLLSPFFGGNSVGAGIAIASAAALASFLLFYSLARDLFDEAVARRSLLFLVLFPTSFYLFAAYTESLFLALILGAFITVRMRCWGLGCMLAAFAAMTRPQGMLLLFPLALEFLSQYRNGMISPRRALLLLLVGAGGIAHFILLTTLFGSPMVWFQTQSWWHRPSLPWEPISAAVGTFLHGTNPVDAIVIFPDPFFAIIFLIITLWSLFRLKPMFTAYMAVMVLPPLFGMTTYSQYLPLASMSRYVLLAFPAFVLLGTLPRARWQPFVLTFSLLLQTLWLILFESWIFVG